MSSWTAPTAEPRTNRLTALTSFVWQRIEWLRNRRRIRRNIDKLMALDDRLLKDIGLSRSDIEFSARYGRLRN